MINFTAHKDSVVDPLSGEEIKGYNIQFESPFVPSAPGLGGLNSTCYVIYRGWFGTYKIRECYVTKVWFDGSWGWRMDNGWSFLNNELGKTVFPYNELQIAIEICEKNNRMRKVKVKYL